MDVRDKRTTCISNRHKSGASISFIVTNRIKKLIMILKVFSTIFVIDLTIIRLLEHG